MTFHREFSCATEGCHALICLTPETEERLRETHANFYCPAGHSNYFPGKTEQEKRIEQLERARRDLLARLTERWEQIAALQAKLRTCPLCGVRLRARSSVTRHLRTPVADGGHGACDVELETAEAIAAEHHRGWPMELVR